MWENCAMTESQMIVAEEQIVRLKKKIQKLSWKRILFGGSEETWREFSDSSGLYIAINLKYISQYKSWSNVAYKDMHNLLSSHLKAVFQFLMNYLEL